MSIPAGTQPGKVFTIKGKGVPHLRANGRGDQQVLLNVEVPSKLSADQRKLFEQLAETLGSEVKPEEKSFLDRLREIFSTPSSPVPFSRREKGCIPKFEGLVDNGRPIPQIS